MNNVIPIKKKKHSKDEKEEIDKAARRFLVDRLEPIAQKMFFEMMEAGTENHDDVKSRAMTILMFAIADIEAGNI